MSLKVDRAALEALSPDERQLVTAQLAAYEQLIVQNPLLAFRPHPKQAGFMASREPLKAFLGGNRSGKTTCGIVDDLVQLCDRGALPEHLQQFKKWEPPFFLRILAPDFVSTMEGVIFQKLREWAPKGQLEGGGFDKAYDKQRRMLWFSNGSWIQFLTFEQDLDKLGGAALHRVHYDEEPPAAHRRECLMRLIDYCGDELFTMTPLQGMSWMFDDIYEPFMKGKLRDATVMLVDMDDNPHLNQQTKERVLAGLSYEERVARKTGRFVHFAGMIYSDFSPSTHVIPELDSEYFTKGPGKHSEVYVGIDPGQRHLAAVVWVEARPDGTLVVFDEVGLQGATVKDVCAEIQRHNSYWGIQPRMNIIDPASRNVSHQTGRSDQMEYAEHGVMTVPGQNAVAPGIANVRGRLQEEALLVCANCDGLIDEIKKYRWKSSRKSEDDPKEAPVKTNDHRLDALRYVCMARPMRPSVPDVPQNESLQQRLIREDLQRSHTRVQPHPNGPGVYA